MGELYRITRLLGSRMIRPFAQNIWDQSCTFFNRDREIVGRSHRELRQLEISFSSTSRKVSCWAAGDILVHISS